MENKMAKNAADTRRPKVQAAPAIIAIILGPALIVLGIIFFDQVTKDRSVAKVDLEQTPNKPWPLKNLNELGVSFVDQIEKDAGIVKTVLEGLPNGQGSLKTLAAKLVEQDSFTLNEMNIEQGDDLWLIDAKTVYPERFMVSPEWFSLVAQNKDIPDYQKKRLVVKAGEGPLSTNDAARWIQDASDAMKSKAAYEAQQDGVKALSEAIDTNDTNQ